MTKILAAVFIAVFASAAQAKDIAISLNDEEQRLLLAMIDMAVKSGGLPAARIAVHFEAKLQEAAKGFAANIQGGLSG
jgi:hypothetical protein